MLGTLRLNCQPKKTTLPPSPPPRHTHTHTHNNLLFQESCFVSLREDLATQRGEEFLGVIVLLQHEYAKRQPKTDEERNEAEENRVTTDQQSEFVEHSGDLGLHPHVAIVDLKYQP